MNKVYSIVWQNLFDSNIIFELFLGGGGGRVSSCANKPQVPSKRNYTNLCGIKNQGATCYLNTLIQTLFLTPEFRGVAHLFVLLSCL